MSEEILTAVCAEDGERLDVCAARVCVSRAQAARLIREGRVTVNGQVQEKARYELRAGDQIAVTLPPVRETRLVAQDIPIELLYEDEYLAVVNKPAGLVVHPGAGNPDGSLSRT